jgi:hypothetical protein
MSETIRSLPPRRSYALVPPHMTKAWPLALLLVPFPLALLFGPSLLLFSSLLLAGFLLTYWSGFELHFEERIVFGALLGAFAFCVASFLFSFLVRDVTLFTVLAGALVALALGALGALRARALLLTDAYAFPSRLASLGPLCLLTAFSAIWILHFFAQAYVYLPSGLYTGYINIWGDWATHLSFAGSFAYGHNFPPQFPTDPGNNLGYHFMVDFFAATLIPLGVSLSSSLVLTSTYLALLFPPLFYLVAARFTASRLAAIIAPLIFLLSGGLAFVYLIPALDASGFSVFAHLPREYTLDRALNYVWPNPVLAYLVPQRASLFGFSLFLFLLCLVYLALRAHASARTFAFLGIVTGLSVAFHVHAYASVIAVTLIWSFFNRQRALLAFFLPALALGLPVLIWMWPPANNITCGAAPLVFGHCFLPGWLSAADWQRDGLAWFLPDFLWFWLKNTSLFIPLFIAAHYLPRLVPPALLKWFLPLWLWFLAPNFFTFQPWDWDNTKFFVIFFLFASIPVALLLANLVRHSRPAAVLAAVCFFLLVFAGSLDLYRASNFNLNSNRFTDTGGVHLADWVRAHTSPDAIFVAADDHNSPISTLGARRVLAGFPGWLWVFGLADYQQKPDAENAILRGDPNTPTLIAQYHISYVLIGPQELASSVGASSSYWAAHGTVVYSDGEYTLYRVS